VSIGRKLARYILVFTALLSSAGPQQAWSASTARDITAVAPVPAGERRIALVIGNDKYEHAKPLSRAVSDAAAVRNELVKRGFDVTFLQNAKRRDVLRGFEEFGKKASTETIAVLYYAGHGVEVEGENYLLGVDIEASRESDLKIDGIHLSSQLSRVGRSDAKFSLAIIDACRDNPFKEFWDAATTRSFGGTRTLQPSPSTAAGMMIVYSAGTQQTALDSLGNTDKDPNGLFTREFLRVMGKPGLSVQEVMTEVKDAVISKAAAIGHKQTPALYDQSTGKFVFTPIDPEEQRKADSERAANEARATQAVEDARRAKAQADLAELQVKEAQERLKLLQADTLAREAAAAQVKAQSEAAQAKAQAEAAQAKAQEAAAAQAKAQAEAAQAKALADTAQSKAVAEATQAKTQAEAAQAKAVADAAQAKAQQAAAAQAKAQAEAAQAKAQADAAQVAALAKTTPAQQVQQQSAVAQVETPATVPPAPAQLAAVIPVPVRPGPAKKNTQEPPPIAAPVDPVESQRKERVARVASVSTNLDRILAARQLNTAAFTKAKTELERLNDISTSDEAIPVLAKYGTQVTAKLRAQRPRNLSDVSAVSDYNKLIDTAMDVLPASQDILSYKAAFAAEIVAQAINIRNAQVASLLAGLEKILTGSKLTESSFNDANAQIEKIRSLPESADDLEPVLAKLNGQVLEKLRAQTPGDLTYDFAIARHALLIEGAQKLWPQDQALRDYGMRFVGDVEAAKKAASEYAAANPPPRRRAVATP
jgi:uncharacterized caspase-like protein